MARASSVQYVSVFLFADLNMKAWLIGHRSVTLSSTTGDSLQEAMTRRNLYALGVRRGD